MTNAPRWHRNPWDPPPAVPVGRLLPYDLWPLTKQLDGLGGEWTYPLFMWRAINFHDLSIPGLFYEPVADFDGLGIEAVLRQRWSAFDLDGDETIVNILINVFPSIYDVTDGVLVMPEEDESSIGTHSMGVLGVHDQDTLVVRNYWSGWGNNGIGYVSREYFNRYAREGWIGRSANVGPLPGTMRQLLDTSDPQEFAKLWHSGRKRGAVSNALGDPRLRFRWFESWSTQDEAPAEVLLLELDGRIRVAVGILVHYVNEKSRTSALSELFVWPTYRRKGYGTALEKFAAERSQEAGATELGVYVWQADATSGTAETESFLARRGYTNIEKFAEAHAVLYAKRSID